MKCITLTKPRAKVQSAAGLPHPRQARRDGGLPALPAAVEVRHLRAAHGGRRAPAAPSNAAGSATKSPKPAARTTAPSAARAGQVIDMPHPGHPAQPQRCGRSRPRRYALMRATRDAAERPGAAVAAERQEWGAVGALAQWPGGDALWQHEATHIPVPPYAPPVTAHLCGAANSQRWPASAERSAGLRRQSMSGDWHSIKQSPG